ncbi:hypothetical protein L3X39_05250 [Sabulilitoribacter multivorans]|uniref:Uncharacterized protein n=1 Tax=Flaviramulus multivorans TaxID=1304750 RepID=A0ABS9IGY7_9FLAO|nr:hypothetical protein [Flaviramulus multivorans]MCF7560036.1 hypothetical protein [Flaviramulus multivorans]
MNKLFRKYFFDESNNISYKTALIIFIAPVILTLVMALILVIPITRSFGLWLLEENHPVELLTFITFMLAGIFGVFFALRIFPKEKMFISIFYGLFSICLIFIAMEEIAWGQWFLQFDTPEYWKEINMQGETTLHNLNGIQGNTEILRFSYGFGGIIGILLKNKFMFFKIAPPTFLLIWFLIIVFHSILDFSSDFLKLNVNIDFVLSKFSELIELLIAISSFLYLWLNKKILFVKGV